MKQKLIILIALVAFAAFMITPVMAETLTGTLTMPSVNPQVVDAGAGGNVGSFAGTDNFSVSVWVNWDIVAKPISLVTYFPNDHGVYGSSPFTMNDTLGIFATGTFYTQNGTSMYGTNKQYYYLVFNTWNATGRSGTLIGTLILTGGISGFQASPDARAIFYPVAPFGGVAIAAPDNVLSPFGFQYDLGNGLGYGGSVFTFEPLIASYDYIIVNSGGLAATQINQINISRPLNNVASNLRIYNATTNILIYQSAITSSTANENFVILGRNYYISQYVSAVSTFTNTSTLFGAPAIPTVTPTPTTTIPAGYIVTYFRTFDPLGNSDIHGTNISLYDVEAATWTNYTSDPDGRGEIYTLPYHTVNAYGHYPVAGVYNDAVLTAQATGYTGGKLYYLDMYPFTPAPAAGYTELYISIRNRDDKSPITDAPIGITTILTGAYYVTNSGTSGTDVSIFPNNTALKILVTKSGYMSATIYTNTGPSDKKYVTVDMIRAVVTPTVTQTVIPGEITVRSTYGPGCDPAAFDAAICSQGKDSDMMNQVRDAGPGLIGLAIIATILGLIKLMMK
ncbi:MAG: hypothetical protein IMZ43_01490 [Thermoplasmata archaeon]|nr:hypothetical protein [Thermoplasmata archaeon]